MLKVYGAPRTRATRVTWMLEEIGTDYDYVKVALREEAGRRPEFLALNPGGKVPVLVDGELVLTESVAIVTYLGDKFPAARLVPAPGSVERPHFLKWCCFVISELEQGLWTLSKHQYALPEEQRVPAVLATARWEFQRAADVLVQGLGDNAYILGDRFSAADILIGHTLRWARNMVGELGSAALERYADRLLERPALARAWARENAA